MILEWTYGAVSNPHSYYGLGHQANWNGTVAGVVKLSMQEQCIDAIAADIVAGIATWPLTGLTAGQVYTRLLPTDDSMTITGGAIGVTYPADVPELMLPGTNRRSDVGYPVVVFIVAPRNRVWALDTESDRFAYWREQIMLRYHHQRLSGVSAVHKCEVIPSFIISPDFFHEKNLYVSALLINCIARRAPPI